MLLVGLTVINCGASAPARVFGRHLDFAEVQRDARRADEPSRIGRRTVTHRQPFDRELQGADVAVDARTMRLFLVCFDNNDRGGAGGARGRTVRAIAAYCLFAKASGAMLLGVALLGCCWCRCAFCVELSQLFYGG